jgi:hypothetical protein
MDEYDKLGPYSIFKYYSMQTYIVFYILSWSLYLPNFHPIWQEVYILSLWVVSSFWSHISSFLRIAFYII